MSQPFENVRERLLRAGIAPRHARRYATELREHLADLVEQERASGHDAKQAQLRAVALMGNDAQLAQAMIDKGAPRSLAVRAPWAIFAMLPVMILLALIVAIGVLMAHLLLPFSGVSPVDMPQGYRALVAGASVVANYLIAPLLAAGCIAIALRQRLASAWVWVGLVLVALLGGVFGFHMHTISSGGAIYSVMAVAYEHGHPSLPATLSMVGLRAAILFAMAATAYRALSARNAAISA
jgi:hypothetical protein